MSSPLSLFRKYQKLLMAIFGVGLMIAFTVSSGAVNRLVRGSRVETGKQTVVRLKSGDLDEGAMQGMRYTRMLLLSFMREVYYRSLQRGAPPRLSLGLPDTHDERYLLRTLAGEQGP